MTQNEKSIESKVLNLDSQQKLDSQQQSNSQHDEWINSLHGIKFNTDFSDGYLPIEHPFSWKSVSKNPKGDHGEISVRGTWYKTMTYHLLHTGGFLRLATLRGRVYWNVQNSNGHSSPDWKFHFSIELDDISRAWDILAALFIEARMEIGMKATILDKTTWSESQRGREITVYIFSSCNAYTKHYYYEDGTLDPIFYLGEELNVIYNSMFWFTYILEAEKRLSGAKIRSRGVADGDLPLPGCQYASLRNETFIKLDDDYVYPPNSSGWNGSNHKNPMLEVLFFLHSRIPLLNRIKELENL